MNKGSLWYWTVVFVTRHIIFNLLGGATVKGLENVPKTGPVLLAPVHFSYLDPMIVGCTSPRVLSFMSEDGLFKGLLGWILKSVGSFPVKRGSSDKQAIQHAINLLVNGNALMMFPEGTRNNGKTLGEIQAGISLFARKSNALVVPIGISGPEKMYPKGQKKIKRGHTTIIYGKPISIQEIEAEYGKREGGKIFLRVLSEAIQSLTAEAGTHLEFKTASEQTNQRSGLHSEKSVENSLPEPEKL